MDIIDSVAQIINVKKHNDLVDNFARSKYIEKFPNTTNNNFDLSWNAYSGFEVISEKEIKVNYSYGYVNNIVEYHNFFIINLLPEKRDNIIDNIIDK
jgi:hypothetical protein